MVTINAKCDKMAAELPESAYSDWTIGTRVVECVGHNANVNTFEVRFDEHIYVYENVFTNVFMRTFTRTYLR